MRIAARCCFTEGGDSSSCRSCTKAATWKASTCVVATIAPAGWCRMTPELTAAIERLSPTQRQAADWGDGACLVLAGPGVGKTTVLTTRIARIPDASRNRNFRILALTFTTKAGGEMRT